MITGKLDTGLEPTGPKKTIELKFTDYSRKILYWDYH